MNDKELTELLNGRIKLLEQDVQIGHMSRVMDGVRLGYADENQAMIVVDHLMRIRIYKEIIELVKHQKEKKLL